MSTSLRPEDAQYLIDLFKKRSGLLLTLEKTYLLESRLLPIARHHNLHDLGGLVAHLRGHPGDALLVELTEAMTTNESSFFRDSKPFDQLRDIVLPIVREKAGARKQLRIWSAACSTGQEPYTVAITLLEDAVKNPGWTFDIVGTDLAQKVVDRAKQGIYSQFEVQRGMPIQLLVKYFKPQPDTNWLAGDQIKSMVQYRVQNLLESFASLGKFDIIFCRNVLIYFDEPTKTQVIEKLCDQLQPGGVLFLGSTESILPGNKRLKQIEGTRGIYQL
jgi:chemotaxis protein methyltransferase CheR